METTSSTAIPTTGASLTSGPVYTDAREALTEAPIRAAAPLKSPKCILFYTLVINVRGGASYFDILYHLSFIYIHKISILEVFIVGIAVDENYVRKQKAPLFTIYTHFQRCLLMKRICQITTATSFYNIYTFSEVLAVELLFVRIQK